MKRPNEGVATSIGRAKWIAYANHLEKRNAETETRLTALFTAWEMCKAGRMLYALEAARQAVEEADDII